MARDPRRTVVALAQKLGLSRNTVQARMAQLEKKHVFLSFERRINPASLGYPLMAFISVHVQQQKLGPAGGRAGRASRKSWRGTA